MCYKFHNSKHIDATRCRVIYCAVYQCTMRWSWMWTLNSFYNMLVVKLHLFQFYVEITVNFFLKNISVTSQRYHFSPQITWFMYLWSLADFPRITGYTVHQSNLNKFRCNCQSTHFKTNLFSNWILFFFFVFNSEIWTLQR